MFGERMILAGTSEVVQSSPSRTGAGFLLLASLAVLVMATLGIFDPGKGQEYDPTVAYVFFAWLVCYLVAGWVHFRSIYLFSTAYVIMLSVFHMGLFVQVAFGWMEYPAWSRTLVPWVNMAAWYSVLSLAAMGIGMGIYGLSSSAPLSARQGAAKGLNDESVQVRAANLAHIRFAGWGMLAASIVLLLLTFATLGNFLAFSRFELFYGAHDSRFIGVFTMVFPASIIALVVSENSAAQRITGFVIAAFGFLLLLASGYRTIAMFPLLVGAILWVKLGRRIPNSLALGMIAFVLLAIPVIAVLRHAGTYDEMNADEISKSAENASAISALASMGGSLTVTAHTVKIVPEKEPFRDGLTYWYYVEKSIPNFGAAQDTEDSRRAIMSGMRANQETLFQMVPSDWATYHILREQFAMGGGVGFSGVAEPYLNFGFPGVVAYFFLLGLFFAKLDSVPMALSRGWLMFATFFLWHLLVTVRNDFGIFMKPSLFTLIVMLAWKLIAKTGLVKFLK